MCFRILVCGSRDFTDYSALKRIIRDLVKVHKIHKDELVIVHGGCSRGGDALAAKLVKDYSLKVEVFPALWTKFGKRAGFLRNKEMVDSRPNVCVALFSGEITKGTKLTVDLCNSAGVPVVTC